MGICFSWNERNAAAFHAYIYTIQPQSPTFTQWSTPLRISLPCIRSKIWMPASKPEQWSWILSLFRFEQIRIGKKMRRLENGVFAVVENELGGKAVYSYFVRPVCLPCVTRVISKPVDVWMNFDADLCMDKGSYISVTWPKSTVRVCPAFAWYVLLFFKDESVSNLGEMSRFVPILLSTTILDCPTLVWFSRKIWYQAENSDIFAFLNCALRFSLGCAQFKSRVWCMCIKCSLITTSVITGQYDAYNVCTATHSSVARLSLTHTCFALCLSLFPIPLSAVVFE